MHEDASYRTFCLVHQRTEDQTSPVGLVCSRCKRRLYTQPPEGRCLSYWESQPEVYTVGREPCFVFTLMWDDYRIRSLHPPHSETDRRAEKVRKLQQEARQIRNGGGGL